MSLVAEERTRFLRLLSQPDKDTLGLIVVLSLAQWCLLRDVHDSSWLGLLATAWCFGAPTCSALYLCNLELAHNLCSGQPEVDRTLAILSNWVTGLPYAELVRSFHTAHLAFQGSMAGRDPEQPSSWEVQYVHGVGRKLLYLALFPLVQAQRLLNRPFTRFFWWNVTSQVLFNGWVWYQYGSWSLVYMLVSTYLATTPLHPFAFYFLTSHHPCTTDIDVNLQTRTYSYYGILNAFTLNAGYHRERHLFRQVPWSKLHLVRELYFPHDTPHTAYDSVLQALHDFVFSPSLTLHS